MNVGQPIGLFICVRRTAFNKLDTIQTSSYTSLSWNFGNVVQENCLDHQSNQGRCVLCYVFVCVCVRARACVCVCVCVRIKNILL